MAQVKAPSCAICGATTDLIGREGHGWVCAVSGHCLGQSARAIMGELRAEDPDFGKVSYLDMQRACSRCGGLQNVLLTPYGWTCDYCLEGDAMPDYEALGYTETEVRNTPHRFGTLAAQVRSWWR